MRPEASVMTVEQIEELIRKALSAGLAVVVILAGPATAPASNGRAQATTATPRSTSTTAPTTAPSSAAPTTPSPTTTPADDGTGPNSAAPTTAPSRAQAGDASTAAARYGWGAPDREDDFDGDLSGWGLYDGPGHAGNGRRSPSAATVANGVLTIRGDAHGTTEGMAWNDGRGQKYGRWEGRVKAAPSDPTYNALLLLWPDAENFPIGGELDFAEMTDHTRQSTNLFLHHGADNAQVHGAVTIDATQWHNWAVEWTPRGVTAYVDGKPWWHTADASVLPPGPMHLCVQLDWFPQDGPQDGTVAPSQMQVDWVRQYPVDGHPQPTTQTPKGPVMRAPLRRTFG
jgi:Glycosyl hydrolases family 16